MSGPADLPSVDAVSVIVPTRNSEDVLPACLESVKRQSHRVAEIIVCDGGSSDATASIAESHGATIVHHAPNRSAQRNFAARHARGAYLLFIDSDMCLRPDVVRQCLGTISPSDAALVIPEEFVGDGFWAGVRRFERTFYDGVWWIEAARFYRTDPFWLAGGFDEGMIGPEDWDLDQRIREYGRVGRIRETIDHHEGRTSLSRLLRKKAHYAGSMEAFARRHPERASMALSAGKRLQLFGGQPLRLAAHPIYATGLATMGMAEVAIARGWLRAFNEASPERAFA